MIPASLHQLPQCFCEIRMYRPLRASAFQYGQPDIESWEITERDPACEHLNWHEIRVKIKRVVSPDRGGGLSTTYLNHHHRKGENVCSLAGLLFAQNLRCGPSRA